MFLRKKNFTLLSIFTIKFILLSHWLLILAKLLFDINYNELSRVSRQARPVAVGLIQQNNKMNTFDALTAKLNTELYYFHKTIPTAERETMAGQSGLLRRVTFLHYLKFSWVCPGWVLVPRGSELYPFLRIDSGTLRLRLTGLSKLWYLI